MTITINHVLTFWFNELNPKQWWLKDSKMDQLIAQRFSYCLERAAKGELFLWRSSSEGRLAEIIVLDQFSRNIHRDRPQSFAQDAMALTLSQECVALKEDLKLTQEQRKFAYMPYMHSESRLIHLEAIRLFNALGDKDTINFEQKHFEIIDRFGRYPHRNSILKRTSSPDEEQFLNQPGSGF